MTDSQCVDSYEVEATPVGGSGSTNTNSPTSTVDVSGLDVCQYNYSFVGSVFTAGGVQSELGSPEIFSADLSGKMDSIDLLTKHTVSLQISSQWNHCDYQPNGSIHRVGANRKSSLPNLYHWLCDQR